MKLEGATSIIMHSNVSMHMLTRVLTLRESWEEYFPSPILCEGKSLFKSRVTCRLPLSLFLLSVPLGTQRPITETKLNPLRQASILPKYFYCYINSNSWFILSSEHSHIFFELYWLSFNILVVSKGFGYRYIRFPN